MSLEKSLIVRGSPQPLYPIIQGGMGFAISLWELAAAVALEGGLGVVSSVGLDYVYRQRFGKNVSLHDAVAWEIAQAVKMAQGGTIAINIMRKVDSDRQLIGMLGTPDAPGSSYEQSVAGAIKGGVHIIISGAGLPADLPGLVHKYCQQYDRLDACGRPKVGIMPIVSMGLATQGLLRAWAPQHIVPDGFIVEGSDSAGHQGWPMSRVARDYASRADFHAQTKLATLFQATKDILTSDRYKKDYATVPIIVAGGIYNHNDIVTALNFGADGTQSGTIWLGTHQSGGNDGFKKAIVAASDEDVLLGDKGFGSPTGFPFAFLRQSPLYQDFLVKRAAYEKAGNDMSQFEFSFCICKALIAASRIHLEKKEWEMGCVTHNFREHGACAAACCAKKLDLDQQLPLYTAGRGVGRITQIKSVPDLMYELIHG